MQISAAMDHAAMPAPLKGLPRTLGVVLSLVCIIFVFWKLASLWPQVNQGAEWSALLPRVARATLVYFAGCLCLALAWWVLLRTFATDSALTLLSAARGHMRSQIAKYLPGNVFHFAARHAHGRMDGLSHANLASSAMAESLLLVMVAAVLSAAIPPDGLPTALQWVAAWRWPFVVVLLLCIPLALRFLQGKVSSRPLESLGSNLGKLLAVVGCYLAFFMLAAFSFWIVLGSDSIPGITLVSTVAICWLGGFLVVGAPGGIGVREALFLALIGPVAGEAPALLAAVVFRGVTILADVLVAMAGAMIGPRPAEL